MSPAAAHAASDHGWPQLDHQPSSFDERALSLQPPPAGNREEEAMAVRFVCGSITAGLLAWGVVAGTAERVQAQGTQGMAPGEATLVGCLQRGGEHNKLVLAKPTSQTVTSVPEPTCTASSNDEMLVLKDIKHRL